MAQTLYFKNHNSINLNQLDQSTKYLLFENAVIDHLNPEKYNLEGLFFYKGFEIGKTMVIPQFFPKNNEKLKSDKSDKQIKLNIKKKSFLLKQNELFSKNSIIDAIFINVNNKNEAELYCFNINSHKIKTNIFNLNSLKNNFKILKKNINNIFDFEIKSIFFTLIIDFQLLKYNTTPKILKNLKNKKINYIFYDLEHSSFKDILGNNMYIVNSINNLNINDKIYYKKNLHCKNYELNEQQKGTIKEILRKSYKEIDNEFHFYKNDILYVKNVSNAKAFCITELSKELFKTEYPETFMLYKGSDKKMHFIKLNKKGGFEIQSDLIYGLSMGNNYDYYKIE